MTTFFPRDAIDQFIEIAQFNEDGLIPAIAQDVQTQKILMLAWMNQQSLRLSLEKGEMIYYSRSRQKLWHKGETSGHTQKIHRIMLDCDGDAIVALIDQVGDIACHTGRNSCFYQELTADGLTINSPVLKSPSDFGKQ